MSLKIRKKFFKILSKKINCRKINDLMIEIKIEKKLFDNLYNSTFDYVKKCFNTSQTIKSEKELFAFLKKNKIKNITPNGMIVPKNEVILLLSLLTYKSNKELTSFIPYKIHCTYCSNFSKYII